MNEIIGLPGDLAADLDRTSGGPLWSQLAARLELAIEDGRIPTGVRLENEIALSEQLGVSRPTVRRALQELVDRGLLVRRRRVGTQVVHGRVTRPVELTSMWEDLHRAGQEPATTVLVCERVPAGAEAAERLGLALGADVLHLRRLRLADGAPVALLENVLPPAFVDITAEELATAGLYGILRARGVDIRVARQRIAARPARTDEASLLEVPRGAPLLTMERVAFDASGVPVEFGRHGYRHDRYAFETTLVER